MKKLLLLLVLALCAGLGLWAQDANVDPFAAIEAEELCADEMKMVQGGLPRGAGRTTMVIDGVSGGYLNQWQANLHSCYNTGDDYTTYKPRKIKVSISFSSKWTTTSAEGSLQLYPEPKVSATLKAGPVRVKLELVDE